MRASTERFCVHLQGGPLSGETKHLVFEKELPPILTFVKNPGTINEMDIVYKKANYDFIGDIWWYIFVKVK